MRTWLGTIGILVVATALLLALAYQFPLHSSLPTDGLGDQPFLGTTEALDESATALGLLFPDEMDATGRRFRWTRGRALLSLPAVGGGRGYRLTVTAEGWPADVLRRDLAQPFVHVLANGQPVGGFTPTSAIADYTLDLPPSPQATLMLDLQLAASPALTPLLTQTASFTGTSQYPNDNRPHGLRLYGVALESAGGGVVRPDLATLSQALLAVLLLLLLILGPRRRHVAGGLAAGALLAFGLALLVIVDRLWAAPLLSLLLPLLGLLLLWRWRRPLVRALADWQRRAVDSGAFTLGLTGAALLLLLLTAGPALARGLRNLAIQIRLLDPGAIIVASLLCSLLMLLLLRWNDLNRLLDRLNRRLRTRPRLGWLLLGAIVLIWLGFGWTAIRGINYLGNADYSDNGVVARNLVAGRGWVVDYVTQFYRLNPGGSVTRVQETWPLLQPVWIAPFFAMFGPTTWAARIPNLIFFALLAVIVYQIASALWDRRVGLVAVLLVLINKHMFRLLIYSTSDLGFVVLYAAALWLLWRAIERGNRRLLLASGLLVGLMCWQKTSAAVLAAGMGLWLIWRAWHSPRDLRRRVFVMITLYWILPAALVISPLVARNLYEFGQPAFSTESYDAWLLEYQGTSTGDFESIYRIYTNEGGLPGSGGLPDASWIKRWGYQRTLNKITRQLAAVRDYLLPASPALGPLSGKGAIMGNIGGDGQPPYQWLMAGSLLALVGGLTLRRRQARLMQLVLLSFAPYAVFLALYWHANEERYFVPLIPFLALLAAGALWSIHDAIAKAGNNRGRPLALLVLGALLVLALKPGWVEAADKTSTAPISNYADWQADLAAFEWLKANTTPDAVVMTRVPWQLNFHADRPAVMNPNTADLDTVLRIAQYYQARYLLVNAQTNNKDAAAIALRDLLQGREVSNFTRVAQFDAPRNRTIYIYEFPADYNGVAPVTMSTEK